MWTSLGGCFSACHPGIKHSENYISDRSFLVFFPFPFDLVLRYCLMRPGQMKILFFSYHKSIQANELGAKKLWSFHFPPSWYFFGQHLRNSPWGLQWSRQQCCPVPVPWDSSCSLLTPDAWFRRVLWTTACVWQDHFLGDIFSFFSYGKSWDDLFNHFGASFCSFLFILEYVSAASIRYPFPWIKWMFWKLYTGQETHSYSSEYK